MQQLSHRYAPLTVRKSLSGYAPPPTIPQIRLVEHKSAHLVINQTTGPPKRDMLTIRSKQPPLRVHARL